MEEDIANWEDEEYNTASDKFKVARDQSLINTSLSTNTNDVTYARNKVNDSSFASGITFNSHYFEEDVVQRRIPVH